MAKRLPRSTPSPGKRGRGGLAIEVTNRMSRFGPPNMTLVTFLTGISMTPFHPAVGCIADELAIVDERAPHEAFGIDRRAVSRAATAGIHAL